MSNMLFRMWDGLTSFWKKKDPTGPDLYHPRERNIYSYWNGKDTVRADPMALYKKVMAVGPELSIDYKVAYSASKDAPAAHEKYLAKVRGIFGVTSLTEGGLTEKETEQLLEHFLEFCDIVKKNSSPPPTPLEGTSVPTAPSSGGNPPTPNTLGSGSTASAPSTAPAAPVTTALP